MLNTMASISVSRSRRTGQGGWFSTVSFYQVGFGAVGVHPHKLTDPALLLVNRSQVYGCVLQDVRKNRTCTQHDDT